MLEKIKKITRLLVAITVFLSSINNCFAFGGGSVGIGGGMSGSLNSGPNMKSGISITDPEGKSYNCEPFVDKRWNKTSFEESWSGVYFAIGGEMNKYSGDFRFETSSFEGVSKNFEPNKTYPLFKDNSKKSFSGNSGTGFILVGGGMLLDRVYLASDIEFRSSPLTSNFKINVSEIDKNDNETTVEKTATYTITNPVFFNAKIGYLLNPRLMAYLNAGLGSMTSIDIKIGNYSIEVYDTNSMPPIRLSLGSEFALSSHFRLLLDYSHWIISQNSSSILAKNNSQTAFSNSYFTSNLNVNSAKLGILYRF